MDKKGWILMKKLMLKLKTGKVASFLLTGGNGGFGLNELLGIAAVLILAAFVVIPGLTAFGKTIMEKLNEWWGSIVGRIFPSSV